MRRARAATSSGSDRPVFAALGHPPRRKYFVLEGALGMEPDLPLREWHPKTLLNTCQVLIPIGKLTSG